MPAEHKFLRFILPTGMFDAVKAGTRKWLVECSCGHKRDLWDIGGVRYGGAGEPRKFFKCPMCNKGTWHKIRKKSEIEKQQITVI